MEGSALNLDCYTLIWALLDGRDLARWAKTCRRAREYLMHPPSPSMQSLMFSRTIRCETAEDILRVLGLEGSNLRKVTFPTHERWIRTLRRAAPTVSYFVAHCVSDGASDGMHIFTQGDYMYLYTDGYDLDARVLRCAFYLEYACPDVFSVFSICFPNGVGMCLSQIPNHAHTSDGHCCEMGIHRGRMVWIRMRLPPMGRKRRKLTNAQENDDTATFLRFNARLKTQFDTGAYRQWNLARDCTGTILRVLRIQPHSVYGVHPNELYRIPLHWTIQHMLDTYPALQKTGIDHLVAMVPVTSFTNVKDLLAHSVHQFIKLHPIV